MAGAAAFIAFLPNAPYVLTDAVHMPADLRAASGSAAMTMAVLGVYGVFAVVGFGAYAFSALRLVDYLRANAIGRLGLIVAELGVHTLATIGIVLGRVFRFNSWDLIAQPGEIIDKLRLPQTERGFAIVVLPMGALALGTLAARALVARRLAIFGRRWPPT